MDTEHILHTSQLKDKRSKNNYRITPIITTFFDTNITEYDMKAYMEHGLRIVRFRMTRITLEDRIKMLELLKKAMEFCCEKYNVNFWPIVFSIDIPNVCNKTGFLSEDIKETSVPLIQGNIVELTCDPNFYTKCDARKIYIDDPYTFPTIPVGTEISLHFGRIVLHCTEIVDKQTIKCKITKGGSLHHQELVCFRGLKLLKPPLTKNDMNIIEFAKEFKFDIITVHSIRYPETIRRIKEYFKGAVMPVLISTICEQEGLDNFDKIIAESDGIILAREFLDCSLVNSGQLLKIQLNISAKCKLLGKPFFISGILEESLETSIISGADLNDVTNAMLQGAGFMLRVKHEPHYISNALQSLNDICSNFESPIGYMKDFWCISDQCKFPVNAADACIQSCVLTAEMIKARVIIVLSVTGNTVKKLCRFADNFTILAVTSHPVVARKLLLYSGVMPILYDKKIASDWYTKNDARVHCAVDYGIKFRVLKYGEPYVVLNKGSPESAYCDQVYIWHVLTESHRLNEQLWQSN